MQQKLKLMEQHYENQQDLHQHQQEFWEKQRDTSTEQMNNLSAQHTELIETIKKVPLGASNPPLCFEFCGITRLMTAFARLLTFKGLIMCS